MKPLAGLRTAIVATGIVAVTAVALFAMGRIWWCGCGSPVLWSWDVWSKHNSQHLIDPYSFSHVLHGLLFYGATSLLLRGRLLGLRLVVALLLESAWEIFENTPMVIQRYREATISLDYYGDSIVNSMGDIAACALGFVLASKLPTRVSILGFVTVEIVMLLWIRDSLTLNVLMLIHPVEGIKIWQAGS